MQMRFLTVLIALVLAGCQTHQTREYSATEVQLCREWALSLFKVSRTDTPITIDSVDKQWTVFQAACPKHTHLLPK